MSVTALSPSSELEVLSPSNELSNLRVVLGVSELGIAVAIVEVSMVLWIIAPECYRVPYHGYEIRGNEQNIEDKGNVLRGAHFQDKERPGRWN